MTDPLIARARALGITHIDGHHIDSPEAAEAIKRPEIRMGLKAATTAHAWGGGDALVRRALGKGPVIQQLRHNTPEARAVIEAFREKLKLTDLDFSEIEKRVVIMEFET